MDLLAAGYGSDDDDAPGSGPEQQGGEEESSSESIDSVDGDGDSGSVDSAQLRAAEAEAALRDYGDSAGSSRGGPGGAARPLLPGLPSALDVFDTVQQPPDFLDPEATRPLAMSAVHGTASYLQGGGPAPPADGRRVKQQPGKGFDISVLAPPLKGQTKPASAFGDKRDLPTGAVVEGRAKRYKAEDGPEANQQYTAAQIAMMGGNVSDKMVAGIGAAGAAAPPGGKGGAGGPPTKPMEVSAFLDKGLGAAQLPRKGRDRVEREKDKRAKGQSTHASWKSEAEMVLRQQFDS